MSATVWLMLAAVTALAAWLRCSGLDKSAWIDEVLSLSMADGSLAEVYDRLEPQHMPLYFWILSPFIAISDDDAWWRVPSVLLGIGLIPLVFLIGNELGRPRVGIAAVAVAATLAPASEINGRAANWKGIARTILDGQHDSGRPDLVVIEPRYDFNSLLYNMDLVAKPGQRVRLLQGSAGGSYRKYRRGRLIGESPELFAGPTILFIAQNNMADLESLPDDYRGRVWAITTEEPRTLRQLGFNMVYKMPWFRSYSGEKASTGPTLFMRPSR